MQHEGNEALRKRGNKEEETGRIEGKNIGADMVLP